MRGGAVGASRRYLSTPHKTEPLDGETKSPARRFSIRKEITTLPNLLTMSRLVVTPYLGYLVASGEYKLGLAAFAYCSVTDWLDGFIARRWKMESFVGSLLDPLADKTLMTVLTVTLAMQGLLPLPLAGLILARDVGLVISAFYYRYRTLPPPFTLARFFDVRVASARVHPSLVNTALQLGLMGVSLVYPVLGIEPNAPLEALQLAVAVTTIWSGVGYMTAKNTVRSI
ncbi:CDP-alcohol phosphatidyltransferase-domain-containing protein [Thamnocephalis sphaerospora]|uniref:CDP-alcohol phosphatidyltransferase-domain-containing protein n=1 Tax=Thamnocephalis sphaerospora TaxID=78915 RepID=A0A4P9XTG7_9FUNG|nr:CDP-alcohol phosphatidyltransferase-domain-containing protein [Thamnocephalis sphaerospora]|eukprot:RKP09453.1 CDP-alcohol phosphatidyltransferase-domain-containing protein [Thamnocephalis sphaerospora]